MHLLKPSSGYAPKLGQPTDGRQRGAVYLLASKFYAGCSPTKRQKMYLFSHFDQFTGYCFYIAVIYAQYKLALMLSLLNSTTVIT